MSEKNTTVIKIHSGIYGEVEFTTEQGMGLTQAMVNRQNRLSDTGEIVYNKPDECITLQGTDYEITEDKYFKMALLKLENRKLDAKKEMNFKLSRIETAIDKLCIVLSKVL